jgi:hypothetical protein
MAPLQCINIEKDPMPEGAGIPPLKKRPNRNLSYKNDVRRTVKSALK